MGIDTDTVIEKMSLDENDGHSFSNVVMPDGSYVIRMPHTHMQTELRCWPAKESMTAET